MRAALSQRPAKASNGRNSGVLICLLASGLLSAGLRAAAWDFVIEAEDFNYGGGQFLAVASTMPYYGGAYNGMGAIANVDYANNDGVESDIYRLGESPNVDMFQGGDTDRGAWTVTTNYRIGWTDPVDWYNYTRSFPTGYYNIYVALSHSSTAAHMLTGSLQQVTSGANTTSQTLQPLGSFDAPGSGAWGLNSLVPLKAADGTLAQVSLQGLTTLRYSAASGDPDYLAFHLIQPPPLIATSVQGQGSVTKVPDKSSYAVGEPLTLSAIPARWFAFTRWGDGLTNNPRLVTVGIFTTNYTAIFSPTTAVETVTFGVVSRTAPVGMPAIFVDGTFVVTTAIARLGRAEIAMQTTFPNGTVLYTLDGSLPTFVSIRYDGPFELGRSATIRATAWDANFSTSWEADPVNLVIQPTYSLTATTAGGGTISLDPMNGPYLSNTVVTLTAAPASGWSFLQWLGDTSGTNPASSVVMTRDKCVQAIFGTTLGAVAAGSGSVELHPNAALFPYGTAVTLTPVPQAGNYFALWGNAVSSTNNPLRFVVTNANPTISAAFAPLNAGQFALTVIESGRGQVVVSPRANRYNNGQTVTLLAKPDSDQDFIGWSGDGGGILNPLFIGMNQNKIITANFTKRPQLTVVNCPSGLNDESFQLLLTGEFGEIYEIDQSIDLVNWSPLSSLTNSFGTAQFTEPLATNVTQRFYRAVQTPPAP